MTEAPDTYTTDGGDVDPLTEYRTAPLKFPLHILDQYGEPLCGNLAGKQERYLGREGYTHLPTVSEKRGDEPWDTFLGSVCGNCRSSLLARVDDDAVHEGWERRQEAIKMTDGGRAPHHGREYARQQARDHRAMERRNRSINRAPRRPR